jgi:hypothetical protein
LFQLANACVGTLFVRTHSGVSRGSLGSFRTLGAGTAFIVVGDIVEYQHVAVCRVGAIDLFQFANAGVGALFVRAHSRFALGALRPRNARTRFPVVGNVVVDDNISFVGASRAVDIGKLAKSGIAATVANSRVSLRALRSFLSVDTKSFTSAIVAGRALRAFLSINAKSFASAVVAGRALRPFLSVDAKPFTSTVVAGRALLSVDTKAFTSAVVTGRALRAFLSVYAKTFASAIDTVVSRRTLRSRCSRSRFPVVGNVVVDDNITFVGASRAIDIRKLAKSGIATTLANSGFSLRALRTFLSVDAKTFAGTVVTGRALRPFLSVNTKPFASAVVSGRTPFTVYAKPFASAIDTVFSRRALRAFLSVNTKTFASSVVSGRALRTFLAVDA